MLEVGASYTAAVVDKYNLAWFMCLMLGVGQLFPWNAFITAYDYYQQLFSPFPTMFALPIANNWSSLAMFLVLSRWGKNWSVQKRLYGSIFVCFLMLALVPTINLTGSPFPQTTRVWMTLGLCFVAGGMSAIMVGTSFAVVAHLPPEYITALMSGQGVAGVFVGGLKLVFNYWVFTEKATNPAQVETEGIVYFFVAAFIMLLVAVSVAVLQKTEFYKFHQRKAHKKTDPDALGESDTSLSATSEILLDGSRNETDPLLTGAEPPTNLSVMKKIWPGAFNVFFTFVITLSLFPGFTTAFRNYDPKMKGADYTGNLIALFQLFDFIGRTIPRWKLFPPRRFLWIVIFSRLVFYPLFMLLVFTDVLSTPGNAVGYIVMILFSITNGYWSTVGMIYGPQDLEAHEQETGGFLMGFSLQFGVFVGVHLAMILLYITGFKLV